MILKGRVLVGQTSTYHIVEKGGQLKMVSFIDSRGDILSGSYGQLHIACASDEYLHLEFARHKVYVRGQYLAKISRAISAHRLVYLAESENEGERIREPFVHKISFVMGGHPEGLQDYLMA
jgi:hypothetical protein